VGIGGKGFVRRVHRATGVIGDAEKFKIVATLMIQALQGKRTD
jgi:hypothetical protein